MEPVWKKALRKAYYKTGDFCNRPVPSVGCERSPAWCAVELYFYGMYYFVLIMLGIAVEPVRDHILEVCHIDPETKTENNPDCKDMGDYCSWRVIFPCKWIESRMVYVLQYDKAF